MPSINKIHITGFKAFPNDFELQLEGKHLLMYGENGSGKSSIYYALHCIFQAPLKSDIGKKYFNVDNEQHLKNVNNLTVDSKIIIDFTDNHPWIYRIDKDGYNTELLGGVHPLPANINGCFINHQFLFHFLILEIPKGLIYSQYLLKTYYHSVKMNVPGFILERCTTQLPLLS